MEAIISILILTFSQPQCSIIERWDIYTAAVTKSRPNPTRTEAWFAGNIANVSGLCQGDLVHVAAETLPLTGRVRVWLDAVQKTQKAISNPKTVETMARVQVPFGCLKVETYQNIAGRAVQYPMPVQCER